VTTVPRVALVSGNSGRCQLDSEFLIRIAENSRAQCESPALAAGLGFLARRSHQSAGIRSDQE